MVSRPLTEIIPDLKLGDVLVCTRASSFIFTEGQQYTVRTTRNGNLGINNMELVSSEFVRVGDEPKGTEMDDQTNKADNGKILTHLLFADMPEALEAVSAVLSYGAQKYEPRGWMKVPDEKYEDALFRHYLKWKQGEVVDEESGLPHSAHMACNMMFLLQNDLVRDFSKNDWRTWETPPQGHKS